MNSNPTIEAMIKAVVEKDPSATADTMLISAHLSQMKMFGIRQGVEFFPKQCLPANDRGKILQNRV